MGKGIILLLLTIVISSGAKAQTDTTLIKEIPTLKKNIELLQLELSTLKNINGSLNRKLGSFQRDIDRQAKSLDSLQQQVITTHNQSEANKNKISQITTHAKELGIKISETGNEATTKIAALDSSLTTNTFSWIAAFLVIGLVTSGGLYILKKKISTDKSELDLQIIETKKSLIEEGVKLDSKLVEILETQLKLLSEERAAQPTPISTNEVDHSLAIKVADEITRIQMNLSLMDQKTRGLKQLDRAVRSIADNFQANGYDIPELLNKQYNQGLNMVATMEPDDNLEAGQQIIKRIVKPQINYKGTVIQTAQVVVAYGE